MEQFSCPECHYGNPKGSVSCKRCLLIFEKYEKKQMKSGTAVVSSKKLEEEWKELIMDYENKEKHEKFVTDALTEKNLQFASQQYRKMLELNAADEIAKKMIDKIIQVATLTYVPPFRKEPPKNTRWLTIGIMVMIAIGIGAVFIMISIAKR